VRRGVFFRKETCKSAKDNLRSYPESEGLLVRIERTRFKHAHRTGVARMSFITHCIVDQNRK
jgi:hypothetical protein